MDVPLPTTLELSSRTIFKKVIEQALESRNSGKVSLCCYVFFSRSKADLAKEHEKVMSVRDFCKQYQIKTEMDFINHCRAKGADWEPQLNNSHCRKRDKTAEQVIADQAAEIEALKAKLKQKEEFLAAIPVQLTKQGLAEGQVALWQLRKLDQA